MLLVEVFNNPRHRQLLPDPTGPYPVGWYYQLRQINYEPILILPAISTLPPLDSPVGPFEDPADTIQEFYTLNCDDEGELPDHRIVGGATADDVLIASERFAYTFELWLCAEEDDTTRP